ncbi:MAG: NUDIX domain-containing protein, partial [Halobaculum sp.]
MAVDTEVMIAVSPTYCPTCGGDLTTCKVEGRTRDYCPACEQVWWRQAVPTTSVAVHEEDRVLLIRRASGRDAGRWDLPAGHPEPDEPARVATARELREETGLRVEPAELDLAGTILGTGEGPNYRSINYRVDHSAVAGTPSAGSDAG